jgi:AAA family ATP:ADP antiporter
MRAIRRILNISPEEDKRVLVLALGWAFTTGFTVCGKAARDAIFLSRYDRSYLPLMVVAIAIAVALAVAVCSRLSRVVKPHHILATVAVVAAASMFIFQSSLEGWMVPTLYVWLEVATVILGLEFWLLAAELVDSRQAKRLFGLILGGGSLAAILVGSQLKPFVKAHGAAELLPLVAAFALVAGIFGVIAGRLPSIPQRPVRRRAEAGRNRRFDGYLASIAVVVCAAAVCSTIVDYQFKMIAARELPSEADLVGFFGMFSAAAGFSSLIFQFLLTGRILSNLGIVAGLALLPLGLGISSVYLLLNPVLIAAAIAKFSDQTFKFTVHNSGLECLWVPVPYASRQQVKPWITGTLKSSAEGLSGLAIFFLVKAIPLALLSGVVIGAGAVWVWTLIRLKGFYSRALEEALRSRSIEYSGLELDANDPTVVVTVDRSLTSGDKTEQLFALDLIQELPLAPWAGTLRMLLKSGPPEVQRRVLEIAGDDARVIPDQSLLEAVDSDDQVSEAAIHAGVKRRLTSLVPALERRSRDQHPGVRAAAARALVKFGVGSAEYEQILRGMLSGVEQDQLAALRELPDMPSLLPDDLLAKYLQARSPRLRELALRVATARQSVDLIPFALDCLAERETSIVARNAILSFPPGPVAEHVASRLRADGLTSDQRVAHVRVLRYLPPQKAYPVLCTQLAAEDPPVRLQVPDSLLVISRRTDPPKEVLREVETHEVDWIHSAYWAAESLRVLPPNPAATLLRDHFEHAYVHALSGLFKLLALRRPSVPVEKCLQIIADQDKSRLFFVLDLLDSFLPLTERRRVLPLLESSDEARSTVGRSLFPDLPATTRDVVAASIQSKRDWQQAIGFDYGLRADSAYFSAPEWAVRCAGPISVEVVSLARRTHPDLPIAVLDPAAAAVSAKRASMYSTLEKTIILKSATLFSLIAAETLSRVAQLAEEVSVPADSAVYHEGDPGRALYVVASGAIKARAGTTELGILRRGDSIGEIAVLNRDVYRADVTAIEDTVLLRIEQEDMFDLMQSNTEIMQGVISLLSRRVVHVGDLLRRIDQSGG